MFWKKSEAPSSSFPSFSASTSNSSLDSSQPFGQSPNGQSFNPLDIQTPPAFGDAHNSTGFNPNQGMSGFPTGMESSTTQTADPFGAMSSSQSTSFPGANQYAQQMAGQQQMSLGTQLPVRSAQSDPNQIHPRDIELILSRLELIRSEIENVNHRLTFIEQSFGHQATNQAPKGKPWY